MALPGRLLNKRPFRTDCRLSDSISYFITLGQKGGLLFSIIHYSFLVLFLFVLSILLKRLNKGGFHLGRR